MTLMTRVSRLFKADIHGILDSLEEPEAVLKQAVREMEEEIENSRVSLKKQDKQIELLGSFKKHLNTKLTSTEQQIDYAFIENNEILIKSLLRKKLELKLQIQTMDDKLQQLNDEKFEIETELKEQNDKLKSIIEKLHLFTDQSSYYPGNQADKFGEQNPVNSISQDDIELAFLQEKQRRTEQAQNSVKAGEAK